MSDLTETVQAAKTQAELHTCWQGPQAEMHQLRHLGGAVGRGRGGPARSPACDRGQAPQLPMSLHEVMGLVQGMEESKLTQFCKSEALTPSNYHYYTTVINVK